MIRYTLNCCNGHSFESWFRSADAFEGLARAGHVACPDCGATEVRKALMTPQLRPGRKAAAQAGPPPAPNTDPAPDPEPDPRRPLTDPASAREAAMAELRRRIEERSEYVGLQFAAEARRIHAGEAPERLIHGEARPEDARALIDEGVPVAPLPFLPARRAN